MNDDDDDDLVDWFTKAAKSAEGTPEARAAEGRRRSHMAKEMREAARIIKAEAAKTVESPRPAQAALAKSIFDAVESGRVAALGAGLPAPWDMPRVGGGSYSGGAIYTKSLRPGSRVNTSEMPKPAMSPEAALAVILDEVEKASDEDVMRVASEWLTKVTNSITEHLRNRELE